MSETQIKVTSKQLISIASLYSTFIDNLRNGGDCRLTASMLLRKQKTLGVELVPNDRLIRMAENFSNILD